MDYYLITNVRHRLAHIAGPHNKPLCAPGTKFTYSRTLMGRGMKMCESCASKRLNTSYQKGLCGNRADHAPHMHDSKSFGRFWCEADQSKRLPYAMERKES